MTATALVRTVEARAWAALGTVIDPELDEPLTDLGFVSRIAMSAHGVSAVLRLPTAMCSPNFAFMMVADSADALRREFPGAGVAVALEGNADSDRINAAIAAGLGFAEAYPDEAEGDLEALRFSFRSKAHLASLERLIHRLIASGVVHAEDLPGLRLGHVPPLVELDALARRRADLGLPSDDDALVLVDAAGVPWDRNDLHVQLRFARATRVSIEGNAHFCRGLLRTRYDDATMPDSSRSRPPLTLTPRSA